MLANRSMTSAVGHSLQVSWVHTTTPAPPPQALFSLGIPRVPLNPSWFCVRAPEVPPTPWQPGSRDPSTPIRPQTPRKADDGGLAKQRASPQGEPPHCPHILGFILASIDTMNGEREPVIQSCCFLMSLFTNARHM